MVRIVGVSGLVFLGFVAIRFRTLGQRLQKQYANLASHHETLGLQAAIGDDLKALLIAWLPQNYWTSRDERTFYQWRQAVKRHGLRLACYLFAAGFVAFQLHPGWDHLRDPAMRIPWFIWCLWLLAAFALPWFVLLADTRRMRLFLYVDDLDRCPIDHMLSIIESLMLMLDDPEIKRRAQVCMLVEEESIDHALRVKYEHLMTGDDGEVDARKASHVVRENLEKLFLAHLRLPRVGGNEVTEILTKYLGTLPQAPPPPPAPEPTPDVADPQVAPPASVAAVTEARPTQSRMRDFWAAVVQGDRLRIWIEPTAEEKTRRRVKKLRVTVPFSDAERQALLGLLPRLAESYYPGRWSPRAIRCLLSRYQLARVLLRSLKIDITPTNLATALVFGAGKLDRKTENDHVIAAVVEQVQ